MARALFGSGPGALPSDARTLNIDPMTQRDRQDEALGVIIRLLRGEERFSYDSDWFTLRDAALQILPVQEDMPMTTASSISPSGMTLAGKYGIGALSIASTSSEGIQALPTQWKFAEDAAAQHGTTVDRKNWRVLMSWHIAETREQAKAESMLGLQKWHNEYNVQVLGRPGAQWVDDAEELYQQVAAGGAEGGGAAVIGTPDDLIEAILNLQQITGGFGVVLGFAHDWANQEATRRSWDLVARYVMPAVNGTIRPQIASAEYVAANKADLMAGASAAVMSKIMGDQNAAAAMATTMQQMQARMAKQENDPVFRPGGGLPPHRGLKPAQAPGSTPVQIASHTALAPLTATAMRSPILSWSAAPWPTSTLTRLSLTSSRTPRKVVAPWNVTEATVPGKPSGSRARSSGRTNTFTGVPEPYSRAFGTGTGRPSTDTSAPLPTWPSNSFIEPTNRATNAVVGRR